MAFRLNPHEPADKGVRRILRREIEHALYALADRHADEQHIVHSVRTHCKKTRATLRLARRAIGDTAYDRENRCFRDAAKPLTALRDAGVRIRTMKVLSGKKFPAIHSLLAKEYHAACRDILGRRRIFSVLINVLEQAQFRIEDCAIGNGRKNLRRGLRKTYKKAYHAAKAARRSPTTARLHEWRKQAKYLWYQLELLRPPELKTLRRQCEKLADLLGDDHDFAMLRQWIAENDSIIDRPNKNVLIRLIDRRREKLQENALQLGRKAFDRKPSKFPSA